MGYKERGRVRRERQQEEEVVMAESSGSCLQLAVKRLLRLLHLCYGGVVKVKRISARYMVRIHRIDDLKDA